MTTKPDIPAPDPAYITERLARQMVGACNCANKTSGDPMTHMPACTYRLFFEAIAEIKRLRELTSPITLQSVMERLRYWLDDADARDVNLIISADGTDKAKILDKTYRECAHHLVVPSQPSDTGPAATFGLIAGIPLFFARKELMIAVAKLSTSFRERRLIPDP